MNTKKLAILFGILLVAILAIVLMENMNNRKSSDKKAAFFPKFDQGSCSRFVITQDGKSIKIKRTADTWVIADDAGESIDDALPLAEDASTTMDTPAKKELPADSASVQTVLDKIKDMRKDELISKNPEKQEIFEVDSAKGILVDILDSKGASMGSFRVGKNGPDWNSSYVRMIGSDKVYIVRPNIKNSFFTDKDRWRDKSILKFDPAGAKKLAIATRDTATDEVSTIVLERGMDEMSQVTWSITVPEKAEAKKDVVDKLLEKYSTLKTSSWENASVLSPRISGFDEPELVATIELENGDSYVLTVGKKQASGNKKHVKVSGKDDIFLVFESSLKDLSKELDELKAPPEPEKPEATVEAETE